MSTFSGLNTATTALWASQRGLNVTGQNISNVNTDGYSRQRVDLQSVGGSAVPAIFSVSNGIGQGVDADTVLRIRDAFLESRAQAEHATSAQLTVEDTALTQIQQAFREPGTTGIQSQLADMWNAWQDVASNPGDAPTGQALLQTTQTLVDGLHATRGALDTQWVQTRDNLRTVVDDVNGTVANIATLNQAISRATMTGDTANELSDQRDALVLHLSEQIGATSQPGKNGAITVAVGGVTLVSGSSATVLALAGPDDPDDMTDASVAPTDPAFLTTGRSRIVTAVGRTGVTAGGTVGGALNSLNDLIPTYRTAVDGTAANLATQLNALHSQGYDSATGAAGGDLLTSSGGPVTAASITLAITQPSLLASSDVPPDSRGVAVNGGNADRMSQLGNATLNADLLSRLGSGAVSPDTAYRQMITRLGVQGATASRNLNIQATVTSQVDGNRESTSGVNLDEEMTNMLSFQHAYQAAGRLATAIDQMLDTLINHTGTVGL